MKIIIALIMYVLWSATVVSVLATTFTNFKYEDLNLISLVLFGFSLLNSILYVKSQKKSDF